MSDVIPPGSRASPARDVTEFLNRLMRAGAADVRVLTEEKSTV